eukprot:TRINITY_DN23469_c0_g1_i1.p1 TRINITY_DN23469_c0_g1~~TRINITY_DN23469_c0_g1_i1.p1  ORF type:complete len:216 (-),score=-12.55 TRINITY_DN23469_c0_g1_i1:593-1240(-)
MCIRDRSNIRQFPFPHSQIVGQGKQESLVITVTELLKHTLKTIIVQIPMETTQKGLILASSIYASLRRGSNHMTEFFNATLKILYHGVGGLQFSLLEWLLFEDFIMFASSVRNSSFTQMSSITLRCVDRSSESLTHPFLLIPILSSRGRASSWQFSPRASSFAFDLHSRAPNLSRQLRKNPFSFFTLFSDTIQSLSHLLLPTFQHFLKSLFAMNS